MTDGLSLLLTQLHVRRTPGIDSPYILGDLCAGVNIVYGPNGSGKTTTARAMEAALWPSHAAHDRLSVSARYTLHGVVYSVELDAGHVSVQCDGNDGNAPKLPAPELRSRYRLSLHELLGASDNGEDFAAEIARQSAGGYDLKGAERELGFRDVPSAARKELQALRDAAPERGGIAHRLGMVAFVVGLRDIGLRGEGGGHGISVGHGGSSSGTWPLQFAASQRDAV